ncbi:uncharacterized protein LODBEIA_P60380 [Lodderomyces beijingensis]|uniref:Exonuclease domain-containing protein n=1 Tax=Lodderomyces beijingensis TaxID=1775926 RepID=A0ABP0ZUJ6_9ASCO
MAEPPSKKTRLEQVQHFVQTKSQSKPKRPIVWIDCEMTGLEVLGNDHIIEICCIITDGELNPIEPIYESTIFYPQSTLAQMNEWCTKTHTESGLIQRILSHPHQTLAKVESELLEFIQRYVDEPRTAIMAGNTIHMDKFFMMKDMPRVVDYLHYRLLDVSSIMEFGRRNARELMELEPRKAHAHTAKSDILESIAQLKWYRQNYFKSSDERRAVVESLQADKGNQVQEKAS